MLIMSGEEFMKSFHDLPATIVPIPVYLVSATATEKSVKSLGCTGFAKKPIDLEILLSIVKKLLRDLGKGRDKNSLALLIAPGVSRRSFETKHEVGSRSILCACYRNEKYPANKIKISPKFSQKYKPRPEA